MLDGSTTGDGSLEVEGGAVADGGCQGAGGPSVLTYEVHVRPILGRCVGCHDSGGSGGLDLSSYAGLRAGGDHGPAVIPGDCASSLVWQKTGTSPPFGDRMPADGPPWLAYTARQTLCDWIDAGALERAPTQSCGDAAAADGSVSIDTMPPVFAGLHRADGDGSTCALGWEPATDDTSPSSAIVYEVYVAPEDGAFGAPTTTTSPGATSTTLTLAPGADYDVRVNAVDEAGNRDTNDRVRTCSLR